MLWFINGTLVETLLIILMMGYLDCKEIQAVHSKGDQPGDFFGRNDAEAETPVLWPSHAKSWLIGKDSDAGRDWGQEEKGMTEDEMAGWHHWLDGHESEWTPGVGEGQGGLACCDSWGHKESDTTGQLNWTELKNHKRKYRKEEFFILYKYRNWSKSINNFLDIMDIFLLLTNSPPVNLNRASLIAQLVKNPPAMQETPVWCS